MSKNVGGKETKKDTGPEAPVIQTNAEKADAAPVTNPVAVNDSRSAANASGKKLLDAILSAVFGVGGPSYVAPHIAAGILERVLKNAGEAEFRWLSLRLAQNGPQYRGPITLVATKYRIKDVLSTEELLNPVSIGG